MFKNHLKFTLRNLSRHKVFSSINILGLAIAIACVLIILLWVEHELSYDCFHKRADDIYLVLRGDNEGFMAPTSQLLSSTLKTELPEVINATSFIQMPESEKFLLRYAEKSFEEDIGFADTQFFEIFSFPFLKGNPTTAVEGPQSLVLTERTAKKYFGDEEALGKSVELFIFGRKMAMNITGILKNFPSNSHIDCTVFVHFHALRALGLNFDDWDNQMSRTYILARQKIEIQDLSSKIKACEIRNRSGLILGKLDYTLLPIKKIHLHGKNIRFLVTTGDIKYVYIFIAIAVIILMIAGVNYMNLSTALSLRRTKEIGLRKVVGASRKTLMYQFLGETIILSFLALALAIILAQTFMPAFNQLSAKALVIPYLDARFLMGSALIALVTGVLAGYYPALFLSAFRPAKILRTKFDMGRKGMTFRKSLVVFQFSLSIILIISTIVVFKQLLFFRNSDIGYDRDHILCVRTIGDVSKTYEVLKNELLKNSNILGVSRTEPLDADVITRTDSVRWPGKQGNEELYFRILRTDYDFTSTYAIEMEKGRFYSKEFSTDADSSYVINAAAAQAMRLESPLGEEINLWGRKGSIIGVLKDFNFGSFHRSIEPLLIVIPSEKYKGIFLRLLSIRFKPGSLQSGMRYIKQKWGEINPDIPFNYYFLNDAINTRYQAEQRMGTLFQYFTVLAIFIACLGLYGLSAFAAERKIKEIGIRKVLGASVPNITLMLSKEFLKWVALANLVAWPIAWYVMNRWLQNFAYRVSINWWIFMAAGTSAFLIALLTVSSKALRAATANPVDALRNE
jgi:ABC-type antimicrobial peptide transport system permease subunit